VYVAVLQQYKHRGFWAGQRGCWDTLSRPTSKAAPKIASSNSGYAQ
jgi:hypothetical protein